MSQENVEIWRGLIESYRSGISEDTLTSAARVYDVDIEWDATDAPVPDFARIYRGVDDVYVFWAQWLSAWGPIEFKYELIDAGDTVVMLVDQRMRGRASGIEVELGRYAQVATFKEGRMVHWRYYSSQAEALEAVGLSE